MSESVAPPLQISFHMSYDKGYPEANWTQNRNPDFSELHIFLSQLVVRQFRIAAMIAQAEEQLAQQNQATQRPELVASGG